MSRLKALAGIAVTGLLVVAIVAIAPSLSWGTPAQAQPLMDDDDATTTRYITVVGQGKTTVVPDIARLQLGVQNSAATVEEGMTSNTATMDAILAAMTEAGIADRDIQTNSYNIYLDEGYRGPDTAANPVYRVSNMLTVKVRDLATVGEVLDAAVAAGANQIWGVSFTVEDRTAAEADARAKAMADARARAEALAELAEVKVGEVLSISEVITGGVGPMYYGVAMEAAGMGGGGSINPGELEYGTSIQVTYALK